MQLKPFEIKPDLQVHWYPPFVFTHVPATQTEDAFIHASITKIKKRY